MAGKVPRGFKNNNPLNIRIGNAWLGEVKKPTDPDFEQFTDMVYGLRAGFILLRRYIERYKLNTIRSIISRWAPTSENNTIYYTRYVSDQSGICPDCRIHFDNKFSMVQIVAAMVRFECGRSVDENIIGRAYDMVLVST